MQQSNIYLFARFHIYNRDLYTENQCTRYLFKYLLNLKFNIITNPCIDL